MIHTLSTWLLVAGFFGAGLANAIGIPATQRDFARWGYPLWFGRATGVLELIIAALLAFPATRIIGLVLAAAVIVAAVATILRHREYTHLGPPGLFAVVIILVATSSTF